MELTYVRPTGLEDACAAVQASGAVFLAGGTDLMVQLKKHARTVEKLVSLRDIPELRVLEAHEDGSLFIGATCTHEAITTNESIRHRYPALAAACLEVGSEPVRIAGTLGGNLCTAAPSADSAGPLLAYEARALLARAESPPTPEGIEGEPPSGVALARRMLPLSDFLLGPGQTALLPAEILLGVILPDPGPHGSSFQKFARRKAVDIATVSATAVLWLDEQGDIGNLALALGAVAPTPILVPAAGAVAAGRPLTSELLGLIAEAAMAAARPIDDIRASAAFRRHLVGVLTRRAVSEAWKSAQQERADQ